MRFEITACTDPGIVRDVNQDSYTAAVYHAGDDEIAFAVLCDGMGGLEHGEIASHKVTEAYRYWIGHEFRPDTVSEETLRFAWNRIAMEQNEALQQYGKENGFRIGTTVVVLLLVYGRYYIMNIGDSRAYLLTETLTCLTKDHTVAAQRLERGEITQEEAECSRESHILTQCIGASPRIVPDYHVGMIPPDAGFLLCSDGFRNAISGAEIFALLAPRSLPDKETVTERLRYLLDLDKSRKETDNITALMVCVKE